LGILKAGGAYLPLDPSYPSERLSYMVDDSQAFLIAQEHLIDELPTTLLPVICLDNELEKQLSCQPSHNPNVEVKPNNLAYVIYTSGSTGTPKGVTVEHHSLFNLVKWHHHAYQVTQHDRATQLAAFGFDAAVWEIWPYLTCGASLVLSEPHLLTAPEELIVWYKQQQVTKSFLPTPLVEVALPLRIGKETNLQILLTGGDRLQGYPKSDDKFKLYNHYGPTECGVVATAGIVPASEFNMDLPTIGCPISNTQVYVLDQQRQLVPIGVTGEIYIGGAGVARGYLNQPELTAEKFIVSPFSNDPNTRLYRTGDLARWRADGQLEYIGRIDSQVKLRGNRVELGEIEATLTQHSAVQQAVGLIRGESAENKQLVAYCSKTRASLSSAKVAGF
jgi:amino acid adenylation domain-containing protein